MAERSEETIGRCAPAGAGSTLRAGPRHSLGNGIYGFRSGSTDKPGAGRFASMVLLTLDREAPGRDGVDGYLIVPTVNRAGGLRLLSLFRMRHDKAR